MIELLNIDCMDYMRGVPDKFFDLAIVDPPYGLGKRLIDGGKRGGMSSLRKLADEKLERWDVPPKQEYFNELFRVSKNQIIWGSNYFLDHLGSTDGLLIWDKMNGTNPLADAEIAWKSFEGTTRIFRMHHFSNGYDNKIHPTQKPVKLYRWLLNNYAYCRYCHNEGSFYEDVVGDGGSKMLVDCEWCNVAENGVPKIFDSHLGSGSIAIACHDMKFDLVGCEIDKDYYDAAVKRFENHKKQLTIF